MPEPVVSLTQIKESRANGEETPGILYDLRERKPASLNPIGKVAAPFGRKGVSQIDALPIGKNHQEAKQVRRFIDQVLTCLRLSQSASLCPLCRQIGRLQLTQLLGQLGQIPGGIPMNAKSSA